METISTIYGTFRKESKYRLDLTYFYEHHQIAAFKKIAELFEPRHFFDVGANIGVYSVFLADVGSIETIDAFEPAPEAFTHLSCNRAEQEHDKIALHKVALSNRTGISEFNIFGDLAGNNSITETSHSRKTADKIVTVECVPLDELIQATGERFLAKIDVEGHEVSVVEGAKSYLAANTGVLQVECFKSNRGKLEELLRSLGYCQIFRMKDDLYFTNINDSLLRDQIVALLYSEVALALENLKQLKITRQRANRAMSEALKISRGPGDPVTSV